MSPYLFYPDFGLARALQRAVQDSLPPTWLAQRGRPQFPPRAGNDCRQPDGKMVPTLGYLNVRLDTRESGNNFYCGKMGQMAPYSFSRESARLIVPLPNAGEAASRLVCGPTARGARAAARVRSRCCTFCCTLFRLRVEPESRVPVTCLPSRVRNARVEPIAFARASPGLEGNDLRVGGGRSAAGVGRPSSRLLEKTAMTA